jgi:hypothetical protein
MNLLLITMTKLAFITIFIGGMGIGLFIFFYGLFYMFVLGYISIFNKETWQRTKQDLMLYLVTYSCAMLFGILWMGFVAEGFLRTGIKI